jgi:hypothetical protein
MHAIRKVFLVHDCFDIIAEPRMNREFVEQLPKEMRSQSVGRMNNFLDLSR